MASRSAEIKKAKEGIKGHNLGNAVNVSPFGTKEGEAFPSWTVHVRCRSCGRGVYLEKRGDVVKSWGDAKEVSCK